MSFRVVIRFVVCLIGCLAAAALQAQEITGNISGTVTDPSGSVIPGASVTATNTGTGAQRVTQTTSAGVFFLNNLPVGNYKLSVESTGFKRYEASNIRLDVNDRLNFTVHLEIGAVTEAVEVSASAAQLQTETGEVSNLIGSAQTQAMPLNGRVFSQLVDLVPGVVSENGRVGVGRAWIGIPTCPSTAARATRTCGSSMAKTIWISAPMPATW